MEHKYECKFLSARPTLPPGVRAVYKLLKRLEKGDEAVKDMLTFQDKREDARKMNAQTYNDLSEMAWGTWKYAGEPPCASQDVATHLFFTIISSTIGLASAVDDARLGFGWDPLLCSVNHSCEPNAFYLFNQPRTILRASQRIAKGEEIFIRYCDVHNPSKVRQAELRKSYFFECGCKKCMKGATLAADQFQRPVDKLDARWASKADKLLERKDLDLEKYAVGKNTSQGERRVAALQAKAFQVMKTSGVKYGQDDTDGPDEDELKAALEMCLQSEMWSLTRQPVPDILDQLFSLYFL